jgi:hypothetical protein
VFAADQELEVLRILVDRRRSLGEAHTRMTSQLLLELIPGDAEKNLSARQPALCSPRSAPATPSGRPADGSPRG